MKKTVSIKENRTFRRMYSKGRSAVTPFLVLYCRPNGRDHNRLGVTVSTKLGGAVVRNRARRRLREVYRLAQPVMAQGYDVVLVARGRAVNCPPSGFIRGISRRDCRPDAGLSPPAPNMPPRRLPSTARQRGVGWP